MGNTKGQRNCVGLLCLSNALLNMRLNLVIFWKTLFLQFGENEFAIYGHFKPSSAGGVKCHGYNILFELIDNLVRHTGGLFFIPSSRAVFNFYLCHLSSLLKGENLPCVAAYFTVCLKSSEVRLGKKSARWSRFSVIPSSPAALVILCQ